MTFVRPILNDNTRADPIWPEGTFKEYFDIYTHCANFFF